MCFKLHYSGSFWPMFTIDIARVMAGPDAIQQARSSRGCLVAEAMRRIGGSVSSTRRTQLALCAMPTHPR